MISLNKKETISQSNIDPKNSPIGGWGALRTIIADDVARFNDLLEKKLHELCPAVEILAKATTLEEAYNLIKGQKPELVILDIEFGGPTSFDLLKKLKDESLLNFQLIFLTGYTETSHFINAFKYSALQYLLKPVDHELLIEAINKAIDIKASKSQSQMNEQVSVMMDNIQAQTNEANRPIMLKQIKKLYVKANLEDIMYLISDETMTNVFLKYGQTIKTVDLIGSYEYLTNQSNFFRISQSIIVNMDFIKSYSATENNLNLADGTSLKVSRQRDKELRRILGI